jgi:hypothetical protein
MINPKWISEELIKNEILGFKIMFPLRVGNSWCYAKQLTGSGPIWELSVDTSPKSVFMEAIGEESIHGTELVIVSVWLGL